MSLWVIHSNGWFIQEWSKRLSLLMGFESLVHMIRSKLGFIQKLNTAELLGDPQQFCYGFKGNMFSAKLCKKNYIMFKITQY